MQSPSLVTSGAFLCALSFALLLAPSTAAQRDGGGAASSNNYVLPSSELGFGGSSASATYKLTASFGAGAVADVSASTSFKLLGGYPSTLDASLALRPWLTSVTPLYAPLKGGTVLRLAGTNLHLGASAGVKIGGVSSVVGTRGRAFVNTTLPPQKVPGWQPVELSAGGMTTTLPKGLAVLPLLDLEVAAMPGTPFSVTYRGSQGDAVVWLLSAGSVSHPFTLAGFGHHFDLDLFTVIPVTVTAVLNPKGKIDLPLPGVLWSRPLAMQALVLSTNPGYAPGSFTNAIKL